MSYTVHLVQDAPTRVQFSRVVLPADGYLKLGGGPPGKHRKAVYITNEDNDHKVYLIDGTTEDPATSNAKGVVVWPNTTAVFFTSGDLYLKCYNTITDGATSNPGLLIMEVFYV